MRHDANDRLTEVTYPDGRYQRFTYDTAGNLTRIGRTDGELHRYDFNSGAANDAVGTVHGELLGGAVVINGRLWLNGVDAYVQFPQALVPSRGSYTVAIRVTRTATAREPYSEFWSQGLTGGSGAYLGTFGETIRAGDKWQNTGLAAPTLDRPTHLTLTVDAPQGRSRLYVDGVLAAELPRAMDNGAFAGTPTRLGRQFDPFTEFFQGWLDDFRVFDRALNDQQVKVLAQP